MWVTYVWYLDSSCVPKLKSVEFIEAHTHLQLLERGRGGVNPACSWGWSQKFMEIGKIHLERARSKNISDRENAKIGGKKRENIQKLPVINPDTQLTSN